MSYRKKLTSLALALSMMIAGGGVFASQQSIYHEITDEVSELRELELIEPLDINMQSRQELREWLAEMSQSTSIEDVQQNERALTIFGFIEPGTDTAELESEILGEQIGGFYDPETDEMVVVRTSDRSGLSANDQVTFAHEAVHALQDQHFDLMKVQEGIETHSDDEYLAIKGLIEGDAALVQTMYLVEHPLLFIRVENELAEMESPAFDNAPLFYTETLIFPYLEGSMFVLELMETGGWDAVDAAYSTPPTTTEQILHPEKYMAGEEAMNVTVFDPVPTLGNGWSVIDENTMGEFVTDVFLRNGGANDNDAAEASEGWGGDTYLVIGNESETAFVWTSAWDSDEEAHEFFEVLVQTETGRLNGDVHQVSGDSHVRIVGDGYVGELQLSNDTVTYTLAETTETLDTITEGATSPTGN